MPRLMSFAKTVPQFRKGTKDVTRRDGWADLKPGDVLEGIEWSPRVGRRWACVWPAEVVLPRGSIGHLDGSRGCGWVGSAKQIVDSEDLDKPWFRCESCKGYLRYRSPDRLGLIPVVSARREALGEITHEDVLREGFPGLSPQDFIVRYCAPRPPDPERVVTRIEFVPPIAPISEEEILKAIRRAKARARDPRSARESLDRVLEDLGKGQGS